MVYGDSEGEEEEEEAGREGDRNARKGRGREGPKLGTYVPQRVAKLSRAISRLQRRNAREGKRSTDGTR